MGALGETAGGAGWEVKMWLDRWGSKGCFDDLYA